MGWFSKIFKTKTKDWFYSKIPIEQTPGNIEYKVINPDEEYLNIILKSMRIVNLRKGLSKFYATVHSHIEVAHRSGQLASFNVVTTPGNLEQLDAKNIDRVINLNRRLLGPVPYRGSDVKIETGLFAIKEDNLAEPFINLLTDMSSLGGVSFISAALPYVKPLEQGIELLTGSSANTTLEIGLSIEMNKVETGYYAVLRVDKSEINVNDLKIDPQDFRLIDKHGKPVEDYPYMVFEISSSKNRNDWFNIPEVSSSYNKLREEVQQGNFTEASDALKAFKREVYTNSDLFFKDGKLIYEKVNSEVSEILKAVQTSSKERYELRKLSEFVIS